MPRQPSVRAPLTPVLLGLIAGLILAQYHRASLIPILSVALAGSLTALLLSYKETCKLLGRFVFIASATLCFWAYGSIRIMPKPSASDLEMPVREARLTLGIQTVMHWNEHYESANVIGRVLNAPRIGRLHNGDLIYAQLKLPEAFFRSEAPSSLLQKGLQMQTTGLLAPIPKPEKPELQNDFYRYLKSIGVYYRFERTSEPTMVKPPSAFVQFCANANQRFQTILNLGTPKNAELTNIYVTMLLGDNTALTNEQRERYRRTGTMHFFAISGLHIGVIAAVISQCLILLRVPRNRGPWIGLPLLYLYVEITGASPSAMRAFLMAAFFWASFAFRRQHTPFAALVNSAIAVLLVDPTQLWSLGFQLSYTVVASILLLGLPFGLFLKQSFQPYRWLPEEDWTRHQRILSWFLGKLLPLFAISLSAWLASMPLCAAFFNFIAPSAIVLNMLLVCLVAIVIVCGVLSIGCSIIPFLPISEFVNHGAWLVIAVMDGIVRLGTILPMITLQNKAFLTEISYAALLAYCLSLFWLHRYPEKMKTRQIWLPVVVLLQCMCAILILSL